MDPVAIPNIRKKLIHDPAFPIKCEGTSLGAREKTAVELIPFVSAKIAF